MELNDGQAEAIRNSIRGFVPSPGSLPRRGWTAYSTSVTLIHQMDRWISEFSHNPIFTSRLNIVYWPEIRGIWWSLNRSALSSLLVRNIVKRYLQTFQKGEVHCLDETRYFVLGRQLQHLVTEYDLPVQNNSVIKQGFRNLIKLATNIVNWSRHMEKLLV